MTIALKKIGLFLINFIFWSYFVLSSILLVVGAALIRILTKPFDPNLKILQQYSCFWASLYLWANPFWSLKKIGFEKVDRKKTYVIVSNHQSMADILAIFNTFLHFKWIAKKSLFKAPFLGWNMTFNGYIPIDRGNPESRDQCLQMCHDWLKKGSSILFFPEGTRSKDGQLREFKPGAFRLALETGHDILPLVIQGSLNAIPKHSILLHGKSKMSLETLPVVSILPYQKLGIEKGAEELTKKVKEMIQKNIEDSRAG